jgi:hypothetical protein
MGVYEGEYGEWTIALCFGRGGLEILGSFLWVGYIGDLDTELIDRNK